MATDKPDLRAMVRAFSPRDWMVLGGGVAVFVCSLFPFVGVSFGPFSASINAWHSYALIGLLLLFAVTVVWALRILGTVTLPDLPIPWSRALAIASGVGTALVLLRGLTFTGSAVARSFRDVGASAGLRTGGILVVLAGLVVTAGALWSDRLG